MLFTILRGYEIDVIDRAHFDNRDGFSVSIGSIGNAIEPWISTNWQQVTDIWIRQFFEPWHRMRYEYKTPIASCTDNMLGWKTESWLFGQMVDQFGINGSKVDEAFSAFNFGLLITQICRCEACDQATSSRFTRFMPINKSYYVYETFQVPQGSQCYRARGCFTIL